MVGELLCYSPHVPLHPVTFMLQLSVSVICLFLWFKLCPLFLVGAGVGVVEAMQDLFTKD